MSRWAPWTSSSWQWVIQLALQTLELESALSELSLVEPLWLHHASRSSYTPSAQPPSPEHLLKCSSCQARLTMSP